MTSGDIYTVVPFVEVVMFVVAVTTVEHPKSVSLKTPWSDLINQRDYPRYSNGFVATDTILVTVPQDVVRFYVSVNHPEQRQHQQQ